MRETNYVFQKIVIHPVDRVIHLLNSLSWSPLECPSSVDDLTSWHFEWSLAKGSVVPHFSQRREEFLNLT